jgi:hypothetical protein
VLFHLAEPAALIGMLVAFVLGIYARDSAQVLAARLARDPTPMRDRRLTASVTKRVSPFSAVAFLITGNGWAEPIPMNDVWRKRRFHVAAAILAGPIAYLLLGFLALLALVGLSEPLYVQEGNRAIEVGLDIGFGGEVVAYMAITFVGMFIVSLIPIPPTDGGRVLFLLAPQSEGWRKANLKLSQENWGIIILLALLLLPVLIGFPSVVGQLAPPLLEALGSAVGLTTS